MFAFVMRAVNVLLLTVYTEEMLPAQTDDEHALRVQLADAIIAVTADPQEQRQLARIARFEGAYRRDVATCKTRGAEGEVTLFQILPRRGENIAAMCADLAAGAAVALARVRESVAACRHLPAPERLALYARGSCASAQGRRLSRVRYAP